jgi:hypothetical protein
MGLLNYLLLETLRPFLGFGLVQSSELAEDGSLLGHNLEWMRFTPNHDDTPKELGTAMQLELAAASIVEYMAAGCS